MEHSRSSVNEASCACRPFLSVQLDCSACNLAHQGYYRCSGHPRESARRLWARHRAGGNRRHDAELAVYRAVHAIHASALRCGRSAGFCPCPQYRGRRRHGQASAFRIAGRTHRRDCIVAGRCHIAARGNAGDDTALSRRWQCLCRRPGIHIGDGDFSFRAGRAADRRRAHRWPHSWWRFCRA